MSFKMADLKIGLSGIPGSGKSDLAKALKKELEKEDKYKSIAIIDDYIPEIENETDLALGFFGTYIGNLHAALGREYRDRIAREKHDATITCGTIFETSAYLAQKMESEFSVISNDDNEEKYDWNLRVDASMRYICCLYMDTVRYDKIYHLSPMIAPNEQDHELNVLERNLQAAFNAFELFPVTRLESKGNNLTEITNNRVKKIIEDISSADKSEK